MKDLNAEQKRNDRKISNEAVDLLDEYARAFQERNPNFKTNFHIKFRLST